MRSMTTNERDRNVTLILILLISGLMVLSCLVTSRLNSMVHVYSTSTRLSQVTSLMFHTEVIVIVAQSESLYSHYFFSRFLLFRQPPIASHDDVLHPPFIYVFESDLFKRQLP